MEDAVINAIRETKENGVCLFSPAAASYNFYRNFEEKGRHFKELVVKYNK
jgi:UDP-N-acetylmuramoylalanine--D-glutamate ligase